MYEGGQAEGLSGDRFIEKRKEVSRKKVPGHGSGSGGS